MATKETCSNKDTMSLEKTKRSTVKRVKERALYEKAPVYQLIDDLKLGHVAFVDNGNCIIIPMLCWRVDNDIYLHGARVSRIIDLLTTGLQISVCFTRLEAWVLAKSAFHHSANYQSAILFGHPEEVTDECEQLMAYKSFINQLQAERWNHIRHPNTKELNATGLVKLAIEEGSFKQRNGPPNDDKKDLELPVWSGLIPV